MPFDTSTPDRRTRSCRVLRYLYTPPQQSVIVALAVRRFHAFCTDNRAVPDDDHVRSLLRDQWHLVTADVRRITGGMLSQAWDVAVGNDRYVARLVDAAGRQPLEAGLAAAVQLRGSGVEAGRPVRTLSGGLTATSPARALGLLRRVPGRALVGRDPVDQQFWGDRLGALHRNLQGFRHPGLRPWN